MVDGSLTPNIRYDIQVFPMWNVTVRKAIWCRGGCDAGESTADRKKERGLTLIEVLVAFFILFVVTLAVLQLLSMAYLVNLGSLIRTDLTYRAERVVETVRLQRFRVNNGGTGG